MHWGWIKWGTVTVGVIASCWPVDVVLKRDPTATNPESVRFMHHYLAHVDRKTPAGIAVVRMRGLPYVVARATGAREALDVRPVRPPLVVDFSRNPRKLEGSRLAPDIARAMGRSSERGEKLALPALDAATLATLSSGDDIERLGEVALRLPGAEPIVTVRAGPIIRTPELPAEANMLSWSAALIGQTGDAEFAVGLQPFLHATISETSAGQSVMVAPAPSANATNAEYVLDRTSILTQPPNLALPPTETPISQNVVPTVGKSLSGCAEDTVAAPNSSPDGNTVHILPVVTHAVAALWGAANIDNHIRTNEQQVNNALFWSRIPLRIEFLQARIVDDLDFGAATDKALMEALLDAGRRFQRSAARVLTAEELGDLVPAYKELRQLRDHANADVAVVLVDRSPQEGGGWTAAVPANDILFYSIVNGGQGTTITGVGNPLQHEVGHLFGGRHSIDEVPETAPPSSHGYKFHDSKLGDIGTMMTRNIKTILRYSNMQAAPMQAAPCNGGLLGIPRVADEASTITASGALVARLHDAPGSVQPPVADAAVCRELLRAHTEPETHSCDADSPTVFHFETGMITLSPEEQARADDYIRNHLVRAFDNAGDRAAEDVKNNVRTFPAIPVVVLEGHASYSTGSREVNDWYSFERAQAISDRIDDMLTKRHGLPVFICAYGNQRPVCAENKRDKKGAAGNQRAEISIAFVPPNAVSPAASQAQLASQQQPVAPASVVSPH